MTGGGSGGALTFPENLSAESFADLESYLQLFVKPGAGPESKPPLPWTLT